MLGQFFYRLVICRGGKEEILRFQVEQKEAPKKVLPKRLSLIESLIAIKMALIIGIG
jgi:hypothetical protein